MIMDIDKKKIAYDLAMVYAREMLTAAIYGENLTDPAIITRRLFIYFEEAYNAYLLKDDKEFDFSEFNE